MFAMRARTISPARPGSRLWHKMALATGLLLAPTLVLAVPSYARQTHQACVACHVGGFGPELTPFGRVFKINGYTMKVGNDAKVPLSAMLVESFTHTAKAQDPASMPPKYGTNNNVELQQASLFLAGRLTDHMGMFAQATYSENGGLLGWDNADVRYARPFSHGNHDGTWGISVNNNPTISDVFNSAPGWGYPYMASDLAPGAPAAPKLFGGLGGQSIGATAYVQIDGKLYVEAGGYKSLSAAWENRVNGPYDGKLSGMAPYARAAYTWQVPHGNLTFGGFLLNMKQGVSAPGLNGYAVAVAGPTNNYNDVGLSGDYQYFKGDHTVTVDGLYVHENQTLNNTYGSGGSSNLHNSLDSFNVKGSYWFRNTYGFTLAQFISNGSNDLTLYGNNGSPNTQGGILEFDYNPFGKSTSWKEPFANMRLGVQYTYFTKFSGLVHNVDGAGRNASDNNTLYVYVWLAI